MALAIVKWGVSELLQVVYTKPLDICYDFAAVLNLFQYTLLGKGYPKESTGYGNGMFPKAVNLCPRRQFFPYSKTIHL